MFSGAYLENNLGHEVINLFKTDNGKCFLYLNEDGKFPANMDGLIKDMILVKNGPKPNTLEVIGKSVGLKDIYKPTNDDNDELCNQIKYILQNDIKYGGTYLYAIFAGNEFQYINITFEAKTVKLPKRNTRIIISFDPNYIPITNEKVTYLTQKDTMRRSLREYFDEFTESNDYTELKKLINNDSLWGDETQPINPEVLMIDTFFQRITQNRHLNKIFK